MYNEKQKQEFIRQVCNSEAAIKSYNLLFRNIEKTENQFEKDASNFVKEEIDRMFVSFGSSSIRSLQSYLSMLKSYTDYCCLHQNSIDNINHYMEFDQNNLIHYVNQFVFNDRYWSRETVLNIVNQLESPRRQYVILGLFEGLGGEKLCELTDLSKGDINEDTGEFSLKTGKTFFASKELLHIALESADEYYFVKSDGRLNPYADTPLVYKTFRNIKDETPDAKARRVQQGITKVRQDLNIRITVTKLHKSGFVYYLQELCNSHNMSLENAFSSPFWNSEEMQALLRRYDYEKYGGAQVKQLFKDAI